jgi:hypothetical protein
MNINKCLRTLPLLLLTMSISIDLSFSTSWSATYYIDYNAADDSANGTYKSTPWKRCPGMYGFGGSYSHSPGDIFIFKGGVTWPSIYGGGIWNNILTIQNSGGGVGTEDQYTVDKTWHTGGAWDYPVFDGAGHVGTISGIESSNKSNLIIEYLKFTNLGYLPDKGRGFGIFIGGGSNVHVRYNYISPNSVDALDYAGSGSNVHFHDNIVRQAGRSQIGVGSGSLDHLYIYNNVWEGAWDYDACGTPQCTPYPACCYHGDGFMIQGENTSDYAIKYLYVYNNKFWGDWSRGATAMIFLVGGWANDASPTLKYSVQHAYIYNNLLTISNTGDMSGGALMGIASEVGLSDDINIFNNTIDFRTASGPPNHCIFYGEGSRRRGVTYSGISNVTVKNNILLGCRYSVSPDQVNGYNVIDHNLIRASKGLFVSNPVVANGGSVNYGVSNGNWHVQGRSSAVGYGVNLSSYFTTDLDGNPRPSSGAWTIGAYEGGTR